MSGTLAITGPRMGIEMPADFARLESFREWVRSLGESGPRVRDSNGNAVLDLSPQDLGTHLPVVSAIAVALGPLARQLDAGDSSDGEAADPSTEPDGLHVRWETFRSRDARFEPRKTGDGSIELVGRGDMVLEGGLYRDVDPTPDGCLPSTRYHLADLLARCSKETLHDETDWGPGLGREILE